MEAAGNQAMSSALSGSAPLNPEARRGLERAYGVDLGRLRLHTGPEARRTARSEHALAFTRGDDIVLGQENPEVLAHELAHAVQQARDATVVGPASAGGLEAEAESAAATGGELSPAPHGSTQRLWGFFEDDEKKQPDPEIQRRLLDELTVDKSAWKRHLDDPGADVLRSHSLIQHTYKDDPEFQKWMADPSYRPTGATAPVAPQAWTAPAKPGPTEPGTTSSGGGYYDAEGNPVEGPVTPLASEVSIPVVNPAPSVQPKPNPPARKKREPTPEENAKAAYLARTTPRQRAEDAKRAPPGMFIGQHEKALLELQNYYESVPFMGPGIPLAEAITGEDVLSRPVDRWSAAGRAAIGIGMELAPELLGPAAPEPVGGVPPLEEGMLVTPELAENVAKRGIPLGPEEPPIGEVLEPTAPPQGIAPEAEARAQAFPHSDVVDPSRAPTRLETGRYGPGRDVAPGGLQDLEPHAHPRAGAPRSEGPTRAQQLEGLSPTKEPVIQRPTLPRGAQAARLTPSEFKKFDMALGRAGAGQREAEILELAKTDPQSAGRAYQDLVAEDLEAEQLQEMTRRPGRRIDIGTNHEVTIEGMSGPLGDHKLDQIWNDLEHTRKALITVPRLSAAAEDQLLRLGAQAKQEFGQDVLIIVRQTGGGSP